VYLCSLCGEIEMKKFTTEKTEVHRGVIRIKDFRCSHSAASYKQRPNEVPYRDNSAETTHELLEYPESRQVEVLLWLEQEELQALPLVSVSGG
jgi:hypothetical protein